MDENQQEKIDDFLPKALFDASIIDFLRLECNQTVSHPPEKPLNPPNPPKKQEIPSAELAYLQWFHGFHAGLSTKKGLK